MSNRQPQQADEMSPCNLHIRTALRHTPIATIIQSTLTRSNQTLSQIVFGEVVRGLSRHHPMPTKKRKIDPERKVVEADVMCKAVVVATHMCSSRENASSSA